MIIGLTGSSGSGKSTVSKMFSKLGYYIVDCDAISRETDELPEYKDAVLELFGDGVFDKNGKIDRKALGKIVFSSPEMLKKLTDISHPAIKAEVMRRICDNKDKNAVIDAPLLFESGLDAVCDVTVGVVADSDLRVRRVMMRDSLDEKTAKKRTSSQKDDGFYTSRCTYIIENNGELNCLEESFLAIAKKLGTETK